MSTLTNISTILNNGRNSFPQSMNKELLKEYGWRIKTYLKKNGKSLTEAAKVVKMSRVGFTQALENDTITVKKLSELADYFGHDLTTFTAILNEVEEYEYALLVLNEDPIEYIRRMKKDEK